MSKLTITLNDESTKGELMNYLMQNENQIAQYIDQRLRSQGYGETDTFISIDGEKQTVDISSKPEDKGNVIVLSEDGRITDIPYSELKNEDFYIFVKNGAMVIYHKFDEGVDKAVGSLSNLAMFKENLEKLPEIYKTNVANQKAAAEARSVEAEPVMDVEAEVMEEETTPEDNG